MQYSQNQYIIFLLLLKKRFVLFILFSLFFISLSYALNYTGSNGQRGHREDFAAVLPFVWTEELDAWGKSVTDNLDRFANNAVDEYGGKSTYRYWKEEFGLKCSFGDHRYFFHWGYQRNPWSDELLRFLPEEVKSDSMRLSEFKAAVRKEQQRRNRLTNAATERVLGFGSSGIQARYANAFVTILYDVHILGDYETADTDGMAPVAAIVAELTTSIRNIDQTRASALTNKLRQIGNAKEPEVEKAAKVLQCLREDLPHFIYKADDGRVNVHRHFEQLGFKFKSFDAEVSN